MAFCEKCGAYIPIGDTACPACGYDPEEEARKAKEAEEAEKRRQAEEEARRKAQAEAEAARKRAEADAEARRKAREESWAAQQRKQEEARRRAEQERQRQQQYSGGAAHSQYASQRTGQSQAYQSQYTSQRTGSARQQWAPPGQETQNHGNTQSQSAYQGYTGSQSQQYADMRDKAADSAANQKLSILSYIPWMPLFLIPLLTRKDDDFARYHANQGLSLFLVTVGASILGSVSGLFSLAGMAFAIFGMVKGIGNVLKGKKEPLPLIGNWKLIK